MPASVLVYVFHLASMPANHHADVSPWRVMESSNLIATPSLVQNTTSHRNVLIYRSTAGCTATTSMESLRPQL